MEHLVQKVTLDNQQILRLTNGSLIGCEIDCGARKLGTFAKDSPPPPQQLQLASVLSQVLSVHTRPIRTLY
jgi:hypothetical protein